MKIALILSQSNGGLPHYTAQLANSLANSENVAVFKPTNTTADGIFNKDVEIFEIFEPLSFSLVDFDTRDISFIESLRGILSYRKISKIRDFDPDLVHVPVNLFPQVQLMAKLTRIDSDYPLVVTYHEVYPNKLIPDRPIPGIVHHWLNMLLPSLREDHTVVHTEEAKEILVERGYSPERIDILPHAAYDFFDEHSESVSRQDSEHTVLFFGNIVRYKDLELLTKAIELVSENINNLTCIIAGDGDISKSARDQIAQHPDLFEVRNEFIPNDEVGRLFSRADVLALPYRSRDGKMGHSGVQTIAHSFGLPIVATDVGEFPDLVEGSGAGLTSPEGDYRRFADNLLDILQNEETQRRMAVSSKKRASDVSWERIAERHLEIYADISGRQQGL
ncbi:lipopolysaccharide transferase family protein [Halorubrum coriense DSM 10284]|uniref:Lipopolysaccharide transferase family protein n=1 Tax=Halorubrum coriense DSM 10284 TaxID=1227466 RepID=M0EET1_9EURY|nr:glycosyltransferase family 4 protein [Halorubrum coriense]ELZ44924.1 lipopolysaccharide transferase family protein [Halorubrum coriense DSM 10284]